MPINRLAKQVVDELRDRRKTIATVESCTGGLLSAAITGVAGASDVFGYGFVTYANAAKTDLVGVPEYLLQSRGAVSIEVAASHLGLGANPAVLWAIADRLAQREGQWQPFQRDGLRPLFFRDPSRVPLADLVSR